MFPDIQQPVYTRHRAYTVNTSRGPTSSLETAPLKRQTCRRPNRNSRDYGVCIFGASGPPLAPKCKPQNHHCFYLVVSRSVVSMVHRFNRRRRANAGRGRVLYSHKLVVSTALGCCCWHDAHTLFTSLRSPLMRCTASSNAELSHDALSLSVDCASTTTVRSIINWPQVAATKNARPNEPDILIRSNQFSP